MNKNAWTITVLLIIILVSLFVSRMQSTFERGMFPQPAPAPSAIPYPSKLEEPVVEPAPTATPSPTPNPSVLAARPFTNDGLEAAVNAERAKNKLPQLRDNAILDKTAKWKACDMTDRGYWSHQDPDGKFSWDHVKASGYKYTHLAENIARYYKTDAEIVSAWLASPTHREVMLDSRVREIGVGRCGAIVVMHVGSR